MRGILFSVPDTCLLFFVSVGCKVCTFPLHVLQYVCCDANCSLLAVAGRNGVAHYSLKQRRWHLFGNESQEEDFVVTGGMVWWRGAYLVVGAYNIPANDDELRLYSQQHKLDDQFSTVVKQPAQVSGIESNLRYIDCSSFFLNR